VKESYGAGHFWRILD